MKNIVTVLAIILSFISFDVFSYTLSYSYNDTTLEATVTGYSGGAEDVIIPSRVSREINTGKKDEDGDYIYVTKTYDVTSIRSFAFERANITSIKFPSSLVSMGSNAFRYCSNLTSVDLSNVTDISHAAFYCCSKLESIDLSNVTSIDSSAFKECDALKKVETSKKLTSLGQSAFFDCSSLVEANIDGTDLHISFGVFRYCSNLNKLNFGDGVISLSGPSVGGLTTSYMFDVCSNLEYVNFGSGITEIPEYFFYKCGSLKEVTGLSNVTSIGSSAFRYCSNLTSLDLSNVESIGSSAFRYCSNLTSVDLSNVESIGSSVFYGCTNLQSLDLSNVTSIGYSAFFKCTNLQSVDLSNVESIGDSAFRNCLSLSEVHFNGLPPTVGSSSFSSVKSGARGYYPREYKSSWLKVIDASGKWNGLIMHELSQPILEIESIDFDNDGVTFLWDDSLVSGEVNPSPLSYTYSIYMGTSNDKTAAKKIASGIRGNTWATNEFYSIKPVLSPLYFWVEAEGDDFNIPISNCLETRNRHGLAYGFTGDKTLGDAFSNDANLFSKMAEAKGNFMIRIGCDCPEDEMRREIWEYAENIVKPGDIFCFFISNHGSDGFLFVENNISGYTESELREDINKFSDKNVAVISIIMACHSDGMVKGKRKNEAFVVSCLEDQYSVVIKDKYSYFSWYMSVAGWERSYADARLIGFEDQNGNEDGNITFYELANYTKQLYKGGDITEKKTFWFNTPYNESCLSDVQIHGERLLKNIVVAENAYFKKLSKPKLPYLFALSHNGDKTMGIQFRQVEGAQQYRIYRGVDNGKMELYWPFVRTTEAQQKLEDVSGNDINTKIGKTYSYYIRSLNEMAMSDPSEILSAFCGKMSIDYLLTHASHLIGASAEPTSEQLEEAYNTKTVNGYTYGECFVAGLDPKDPNAKFIAKIDMIDGLPNVSWEPDLGDERNYIVEGKENLDDENWLPANDTHKFFRVRTSLPDEMQEDDDSGSSEKIVTVFFEPRDGSVSIDNITYHSGTVVGELPTPTLEGHTFMGWYDNIIDGNKYTSASDVPDEDIVLYAIWEPETYIVKFNANGGTGEMSDQAFTYGVEQTLAVNTFSREGYIFVGWATSPDGDVVYELDESITLTSSQTLYAVWTVNTY